MSVPIDWANVDWLYVVLLAVFVLIASFVGNMLSFYHRGFAALLSAVLFAIIFVFWTYYPFHVPFLPKTLATGNAAVTTAPAPPPAPPAPVKPSNPITDITPPKAQ
jgi:uncharacterized membrane protein YfcA